MRKLLLLYVQVVLWEIIHFEIIQKTLDGHFILYIQLWTTRAYIRWID